MHTSDLLNIKMKIDSIRRNCLQDYGLSREYFRIKSAELGQDVLSEVPVKPVTPATSIGFYLYLSFVFSPAFLILQCASTACENRIGRICSV